MKYVPRILEYLRPYRALAAASLLVTAVEAVVALLAPWPLKILVDNVIQNETGPQMVVWLRSVLGANRILLLLAIVAASFLLTLLTGALDILSNYVNTKLQEFMVLDLRSNLFQHAQRLSLAFHDRKHSGKLVYVVNQQSDAASALVMAVPQLAASVLTLIGMFVISYRISASLALLSLTVLPFVSFSTRFYTRHLGRQVRKVREMESTSLSIVMEAFAMLRVIIAFGREQHEFRRFREQGEQTVNARVKLTVGQALFSSAVRAATGLGNCAVLGVGVYYVLEGRITVGQLLVVLNYIAAVYRPVETISMTANSIQQKLVNLQAALELLDTPPDIAEPSRPVVFGRAAGAVVFENVSFAYAGRGDTLRDISFEVAPGQVVAIVGPTGAGKTTLISLLPRFYDPASGRVLIDGHDIRKVGLKTLRDQFSIVLQEPLLFSGTIADNIRYGRLDATDEEVIAAAEAANAHEFIMRLPNKYDTVLGEKGGAVSGGERQRIAVARAFLKDAPILILDEPTSSIDSKTEAVILDALDRLMVGRTTFLIAHRLNTVRNADFILVLNHGSIVEQGRPQQLIHSGGLYQQLYDAQMARLRQRPQTQSLS